MERLNVMTPPWTHSRDPSHKSHNAFDKYPTIHHFVTEMHMWTFLLQNGALWDMGLVCIVGKVTSALWDLCNSPISHQVANLQPPYGKCHDDLEMEYFEFYTHATCQMDCEERYLVKHCNCRMHYMPELYPGKSQYPR